MKSVSIVITLLIQTKAKANNKVFDDGTSHLRDKATKRSIRLWQNILKDEESEFGAINGVFEWSRELDMSLSLSFNHRPKPTIRPLFIPVTRPKTQVPSMGSSFSSLFPTVLSPSTLSPVSSLTITSPPSAISPNVSFPGVKSPNRSAPNVLFTNTSFLNATSPNSLSPSTLFSTQLHSPSTQMISSISNPPSTTANANLFLSKSTLPSTILAPSSTQVPVKTSPFFLSPAKTSIVQSTSILTRPPTVENIGIYECLNQSVIHAPKIVNGSTLINLSIAYAAAVNESKISSAVINNLEAILLETAITAALQCNVTDRNQQNLSQQHRNLLTSTDILGNCNATRADVECFVIESDLAFIVNKVVNSQFTSYLAYIAMQKGMLNNIFIGELEQIQKLTYLAPLPLLPQPNNTQPLDAFDHHQGAGGGKRTRSWTIGACVAMSTGGVATLAAWFYSQRAQTKAHIGFIDDRSLSHSPIFSTGNDHTGEA